MNDTGRPPSRVPPPADPHAADLELVRACVAGDQAAFLEVERRFRGELAGALSRIGLTRAEIDEVGQTVRERLFVNKPGSAAKIAEYSGKGALASWFRAVIVRAGIDLRRSRQRVEVPTGDDEPLLTIAGATDDPEIENLRARYAEPFKQALADAVRALPTDERNALRLNVALGLNIEQIGQIYGVHRATIARWIASARETIAAETRRLLVERLKLHPAELDSLVRLCRSRIDIGPSILE
ncbi:MAG: sigma-70 family RNA polymerase sigma factor [Deltaproteobacteria bacterium]|nr:sigma-70 family RNA polymerase sigma factor [Deltaproteobacteria bacterium]